MMNGIIKVNYPQIPNFGDLLNVDIIEKIFGYKVVKESPQRTNLSAIGSGLGGYQFSGSIKNRIRQFILGILHPNVYVWGTGFIEYIDQDPSFYRRNIKFVAVRGELTKSRVEKILGRKLDIPTGDGGLLSSMLIESVPAKKYSVGIIAHFKEQDEPIFQKMVEHYENSTFIDVKKDPITVIREIAECECVISSSLHGLIIADSFHIPGLHVKLSSKLMGDGYKFDDYYSGYGLQHEAWDLNQNPFPTLDYVKNRYMIPPQSVEEKKKELVDKFPFPHEHITIR